MPYFKLHKVCFKHRIPCNFLCTYLRKSNLMELPYPIWINWASHWRVATPSRRWSQIHPKQPKMWCLSRKDGGRTVEAPKAWGVCFGRATATLGALAAQWHPFKFYQDARLHFLVGTSWNSIGSISNFGRIVDLIYLWMVLDFPEGYVEFGYIGTFLCMNVY